MPLLQLWITNGARSDTELGDAFLVYARTSGGTGAAGQYSLFLVDKGMPGFSLGQRLKVREEEEGGAL